VIRKTIKYYDSNAEELTRKYNSVDFNFIQKSISIYLIGAKNILEIGVGSGRDANYLVNNGFELTGIDGSEEMLKKAEINYPNLKGRLIKSVLPDEFPDFENKFDGAYSIATLMHLDAIGIDKVLKNLKSVLLPNSPVYISVSGKRKQVDERYFIDFTKMDWINTFEQNNFIINEILENRDATNRDIVWYSFLMETR